LWLLALFLGLLALFLGLLALFFGLLALFFGLLAPKKGPVGDILWLVSDSTVEF
jgi:hypothetical protein